MEQRNTVIRSMHDLGLAAWFGGQLMGAVGLNGASATAQDPRERLRLASAGWARWAPVQAAALAVHAIGGTGLILANRDRLLAQPGSRWNTVVKLGLTLAAAGSTAYSGLLGMRMAKGAEEGTEGVTEPSPVASAGLAAAQNQQRVFQWVTPLLTAVVIVLAAQQGEQQREASAVVERRFLGRLLGR